VRLKEWVFLKGRGHLYFQVPALRYQMHHFRHHFQMPTGLLNTYLSAVVWPCTASHASSCLCIISASC